MVERILKKLEREGKITARRGWSVLKPAEEWIGGGGIGQYGCEGFELRNNLSYRIFSKIEIDFE
jgi:hypothetical protein